MGSGQWPVMREASSPGQVPLSDILAWLNTLAWKPRIPASCQFCLLQTHSCSRKGHENSKTQSKFHIWPQLAVCFTLPIYTNEPITRILTWEQQNWDNRIQICSCLEENSHGLSTGIQRLCRNLEGDRLGSEGKAPIQAQPSSLPAPLTRSQHKLEEAAAVVLWGRQAEVHLALLGFPQHLPQWLFKHTHAPTCTSSLGRSWAKSSDCGDQMRRRLGN